MSKLFDLSGQTAVVTGGTRGIGAAIAVALAEAGADIILIQRNTADADTKKAIEAKGGKAMVYEAHLDSPESVKKVCNEILKQDKHDVSILVNCGGIQRRKPARQFTDEDWNDVLQVNLTAVFTLCREFGNYMLDRPATPGRRRGSIINIASLLSFIGGITVPAYAASKGGVAQLTKALSNEWAKSGVNVNAIAPGYVDTEMNTALMADEKRREGILARIPAGRWAKPEDFEGPAVFLASEASSYISGHVLAVDGGWLGL